MSGCATDAHEWRSSSVPSWSLDGRRLRCRRAPASELSVVEVHGELDLLTAGRLTAALNQPVRRGSLPLAIDLSRTTFMGVAGLHVLLAARRRLERRDRAMLVVAPPGAALRVIETIDRVGALDVHPTLTAACTAVRRDGQPAER